MAVRVKIANMVISDTQHGAHLSVHVWGPLSMELETNTMGPLKLDNTSHVQNAFTFQGLC